MSLDLNSRVVARLRLPKKLTFGALVSNVVARLASAQLARAHHRQQARGSPPLSPHLRHDIGLPPYEEAGLYIEERW